MAEASDRKIILEDGQEFYGHSFGAAEEKILEIVFNTSMVGYQEILSAPSYTDQAVVMTYPLIGNYGMAAEDYETAVPTIGALLVREYNDEPSSFRSTETLGSVMERFGIPGVQGIDTRMLTRSIRDRGSRKVLITDAETSLEEGLRILRDTELPHDAVARVSCKAAQICEPGNREQGGSGERKIGKPDDRKERSGRPPRDRSSEAVTEQAAAEPREAGPGRGKQIVAIDCGMKENIVRSFNRRGIEVIRVPWNTTAEAIRELQPDGIFISNGPGDPEDVPETIGTVRALIGNYPVFGICLGHQILSLAYGAKTYKLKFGHRGGNHPVRDVRTDRIIITSQNHSYAVDAESMKTTGLKATHINLLDGTVEGAECIEDRVFSLQFHPESAPGPLDGGGLFEHFMKIIIANDKNNLSFAIKAMHTNA